jgi:hypothetical protein
MCEKLPTYWRKLLAKVSQKVSAFAEPTALCPGLLAIPIYSGAERSAAMSRGLITHEVSY